MRPQAMQVTAWLCDPLHVTPCSYLRVRRRTAGFVSGCDGPDARRGSPVVPISSTSLGSEGSGSGPLQARGTRRAREKVVAPAVPSWPPRQLQAAASAQEKTHRARSRTRRHAPGHGHATHDKGDTKHGNFLSLVASLLPIVFPWMFLMSPDCLDSKFLKGTLTSST